jgi:hypothetical protein
MTDRPPFDDPLLVRRLGDWMDDQREVRAPGRLVDAVMAEVVAQPHGGRWAVPLRRWQGIAAYGALTAVVAIGVTLGILLAQTIGDEVGRPSASPSPSPSASPSPGASTDPAASGSPAQALVPLAEIPIEATAIATGEAGLWVVDATNRLAELDPATGVVRRSVALPRRVDALLATPAGIWAASVEGNLVRVDPTTLAVVEIAEAVGGALALGEDGSIWLGQEDGLARIDPAANVVNLAVAIANRGAGLGVTVLDGDVWVATRSQIVRLDALDGAVIARLDGDATALGVADGAVWASRGIELLRIEPSTPSIVDILAGIPARGPMTVSAGRIWIAGSPGAAAGTIVGVDAAAGRIVFETTVDGSVIDLAFDGSVVWAARDEGGQIGRFALP